MRNKCDEWLKSIGLSVVAMIVLMPIIMTVLYSFFPSEEIVAFLDTRGSYDVGRWMPVRLFPSEVSLKQYRLFVMDGTMIRYFANSCVYASATLIGQALVAPALAYALSRFRFAGRDAIFFIILMLMILPFQVTMAPNAIMLRWMNLMDTPWAVILPMCFAPFGIFLLRQYMIQLPNELIEAGEIDGAGAIRCFFYIIIPACKPILCAAAALSFAESWNLVEQPLVYLSNCQEWQPLSVMLNEIGESRAEYVFAGAALYLIPALMVYLIFQKDIMLGIQMSELK